MYGLMKNEIEKHSESMYSVYVTGTAKLYQFTVLIITC